MVAKAKPLFDRSKRSEVNEDRISFIETVVQRLARKIGPTKKAMISPIPISGAMFAAEVKGPIIAYMFPCKGKISKGAIDLGKKPKFPVTITIQVQGISAGQSKQFILDRQRLAVDLDIPISNYDKATASISYDSPKIEDCITECWISFLWTPTVSNIEAKSFLYEELENDLSELTDETLT